MVAGLADGDLSSSTYRDGMMPLVTAVNRIAVVGEVATVKTARELLTLMNQWYFKGLLKVLPLAQHKADVKTRHEEWEAAQTELKRIIAAMTHHNESVKNDPLAFEALCRSFETHQKLASNAAQAEQVAHQALAAGRLEYANLALSVAREIAATLDVLADSVRKELAIATDFAAFRAQTLEMQAAAEQAMAQLTAELAAMPAGTEKS